MSREKIDWPPPRDTWPKGFSASKRGWVIWYKGAKRQVAGRRAKLSDIATLWAAKRKTIDLGGVHVPTGDAVTVRQLASAYIQFCDREVEAENMSPRHRLNLVNAANRFGRFVGGDTPLATLGAAHFAAYRLSLGKQSPMSMASIIARVTSMFRWGSANGVLERPIVFGSDWRRPNKRSMRDQRMSASKSFSADEVRALWREADTLWRCWIALGVCAGFLASDLVAMPRDVIDGDVIDYRRKKSGKMRRIVPLGPIAEVLGKYRRPAPADDRYDELVFLREDGQPFNRAGYQSETTGLFRELQERAGVYRKGRSFSGLRTTCFNALVTDQSDIVRGVIFGRKPTSMAAVDWENYLEAGIDMHSVALAVHGLFDRFIKS